MIDEAAAREALAAFDRLALLVTAGTSGLRATHLPLVYDSEGGAHGRLLGHMARANDHWKDAEREPIPALVVLPGAETYVSPGWYETKKRDGRAVPTWNYVTLHAHGVLRVHDDREKLRANVAALSHRHEHGRASAWTLDDAPGDYIERLLSIIIGVEFTITRIEGKCKLSQDRPEEDRAGVYAALNASDDARDRAVAVAMRNLGG